MPKMHLAESCKVFMALAR